ncbi:type II secretion system F family protein [Candidatus Omnitrophota bacterium]
MPVYKYKAKKGTSGIVEGKIEAQTEAEAVEKLSQSDCLPMSIEEHLPDTDTRSVSFTRPFGKIRSRDITIFSRQLATLLKSGVPILDALNILLEQSDNEHLKNVISEIHNSVKAGGVFSSALAQYPKIFPFLYIAIIRAGEDSGKLHEALLRIADYRAKQDEMLSKFRMAMAYPILMAIVGIGTIIFMLTFVMPRLMNIFINMQQTLPLPTRILIYVSSSLRQYWLWIAAVLIILALLIKRNLQTKAGRFALSLLKLRIPIFGTFTLKNELGRFSRTMELLIRSGVPILKSLELGIPVLENEIIKSKLKKSYKDLEQGGSFGKSLKDSKLIPIFVSNLIIIGEESGRLHEALSEVALSYEHDTEESIRIMTSLLEPLMILFVGLIVGFIVVAMLLPIFEINVIAR